MSRSLFWMSDEAWAALEPHLPKNRPAARRVAERRVISGFGRMLKCGGRGADCALQHGPPTTLCNRWHPGAAGASGRASGRRGRRTAGSRKPTGSTAARSSPRCADGAKNGGASQGPLASRAAAGR